jgi:hypothetical protein
MPCNLVSTKSARYSVQQRALPVEQRPFRAPPTSPAAWALPPVTPHAQPGAELSRAPTFCYRRPRSTWGSRYRGWFMAKEGDNAWTARYKASTEASQTATAEETAHRSAKTARLKQERLVAEAAAPPATPKPPARRKRQDEGKRPDELSAANDE